TLSGPGLKKGRSSRIGTEESDRNACLCADFVDYFRIHHGVRTPENNDSWRAASVGTHQAAGAPWIGTARRFRRESYVTRADRVRRVFRGDRTRVVKLAAEGHDIEAVPRIGNDRAGSQ